MIEQKVKQYNCSHENLLFDEICLNCGKDMWS